jgi:hypothetical protein
MRESHDGQGFSLIRHAPHDTFPLWGKEDDQAVFAATSSSIRAQRFFITK